MGSEDKRAYLTTKIGSKVSEKTKGTIRGITTQENKNKNSFLFFLNGNLKKITKNITHKTSVKKDLPIPHMKA